MEMGSESSVENTIWVCSVLEVMVVESVVAAAKALTCLLFVTGPLLNDVNVSSKLAAMDKRFPLDELHKIKRPDAECKDASDTEDDDEEDDDNADDQDDDDGDEDYSGEDGEEEADPEDDPEANGDGGSDDEDDDDEDDDGDDDDDDEDGEEDEDEDEEEEIPQPPTKKRK